MNQTESKWIVVLEWAAVIVLIILATFLRYWKIGEVPPGFNSDEAVGAIGALTTLREGIKYSYEGQGGGGALGFYFAAAFFYLFGPSVNTIRGLAAWAGVVSIFANYWAVRELFRNEGLTRARAIAFISTLGLSVSLWHLMASRIAFAGIGVPFLMLPSVYFLWRGLNYSEKLEVRNEKLETSHLSPLTSHLLPLTSHFILSGFFLGSLLYIYLSGAFASPLYAAFFLSQWAIAWALAKFRPRWATPQPAYLTTQFRHIVITAVTAVIMLLPIIYVVLTRPANEPGLERASQAFFMNPQISQGDPWGLLWRSFIGNFTAYGVSFSWLWGQAPRMVAFMPSLIGLTIFMGFIIAFMQALRGRAAYLFSWLWFIMLLLPSILSPDSIPHNLRTIGATTPAFIFMAITVMTLFDALNWLGQRFIKPRLSAPQFSQLTWAVGIVVSLGLGGLYYQANLPVLNYYFYDYAQTNDAQAAYHVYAVKMAEVINAEPSADVAFILPRNTAAGDVFRNFSTDFLVELAQPPAAHYWVIDNETTLAADLTKAAQQHHVIKVVQWKTSKHTGADPKKAIPYYLEKYGYYDHRENYEYFDIDTYQLEVDAPDFTAHETFQPTNISFKSPNNGSLKLTGYLFGDGDNPPQVSQPQANSDGLLWVRLGWQLEQPFTSDLKASLLVYAPGGQLVTQVDKLLQNNIFQQTTPQWQIGQPEATYFLLHLPPATPPGQYSLHLAVYGADTMERLPLLNDPRPDRLLKLGDFTVNPATRSPDLNDLKLALKVNQPVWPGLTLVGFESLPSVKVRSGETVQAALIWQKSDPAPFAANLQMSLVVKAWEGDNEWKLADPVNLASADYPTTAWQPNEIIRGWLTARIPPTLEPGKYKLQLQLTDGNKPQRLPIGDFEIEGWPRQMTPPMPQLKLTVNFNEQTTLMGLDSDHEQIAKGETLNIKLYWRAEQEFEQNYTAFVHLIAPDGKLYGQVDHTPGAGAYPTTGWLTGEYITDLYTLPLAADAPPGAYQIEIGLYNPTTGTRLPLSTTDCPPHTCDQANNRVLINGLTVTP